MENFSIYQKTYSIGLGEADFTKQLKLSSLFGFFQDIASLHAAQLGLGLENLSENHGVTWALIRMRIKILRNPMMNEVIAIETWPQEPKKLEFERDFLVRDNEGQTIAKAVSTWVIIDLSTRRLCKIDSFIVNFPPIFPERALGIKPGKLKAVGPLEVAYKKTVGYSDIDMDGHLNNTKYVDFIMDCFSLESHKRYTVRSIEFNYVSEALPEETLILHQDLSSIESGIIYIEGVSEKDQRLIFKSQLEIELK